MPLLCFFILEKGKISLFCKSIKKSKNVDSLILNIMWLVSSRPIWQYFQ